MAKDAELDRLKVAQDLAFQRKQDAYQALQHAWEKCSSARDALNRAHEIKQSAYAEQDRTWQYYQSVRSAANRFAQCATRTSVSEYEICICTH